MERLARQISVLNTHLEQDNDLHAELAHYDAHCKAAQRRLERLVSKSERRLRDGFWRRDALLLQAKESKNQTVLRLCKTHASEIFRGLPVSADLVDPLLKEAALRLGLLLPSRAPAGQQELLSDSGDNERNERLPEVEQILAYARQGYQVDLSRAPRSVLHGILLHFASRRLFSEQQMDMIAAPPTEAERVEVARKVARSLTLAQRSNLKALFKALHK